MHDAKLKDIRIVRAAAGKEVSEIPLAEWLAVITEDPELDPIDFIMGRNPRSGNPVRVLLKGGAQWTGNSEAEPLPFHWEFGEAVGLAADRHTIKKAEQLAARLTAQCVLSSD